MIKVLMIVGPTGSGKTELGIDLAKKFSGEIINADSRQIYKELNIGSAKPSSQDFESIPHHLFDHWEMTESGNANLFQEEAFDKIKQIQERKKIPIIVGGTGLYHRALIYGFFENPSSDSKIRDKYQQILENEGIEVLYQLLKARDPKAAKMIHPHHQTRIIRALEVFELTQKSIIDHQAEHGFQDPRFEYLKIAYEIEREDLYKKINKRVDQMIEKGLEKEVKDLHEKYKNHPQALKLLNSSIGYQEWIPYFEQEYDFEKVVYLIKKNTRNFAKRQLTWFRKEEDIHWFSNESKKDIYEKISNFLKPQSGDGT